ncbi:MAG TPA: glycine cleavage system aminomethyltransferase GcvT [Actinomycetota bacterium]|nr:glycine cleavage system aminomethyltransferase GcvT [Actinomycetota bacterium]
MSEPTGSGLRHPPLEGEHRALGARMAPFAGWLMPIEYSGTLAEHRAVREAVGLFDVSHLGKFTVEGPGALEALQRSLTNDLSKVAVGGAQYGMCLNDRGGIVDDLIAYRLGEERFIVVPNAANVLKVHAAVRGQAPSDTDVVLRDDLALIAPQGPRSFDLVGRPFPEAPGLGYMHCTESTYRGETVVVSRSGYTGERGFELFVPEALAVELWRDLLESGRPLGVTAAGLGARDTLRLEMGYPLHGNDISEERTPLEAGLSWAVSFDKGDFVGRDALLAQKEEGIPSKLVALRMGRHPIPRAHYPVLSDGEPVGETTSGTLSPTLRVGIAMAYVSPRDRFSIGDRVEVDVRGRRGDAEIVRPPFVDSSPK